MNHILVFILKNLYRHISRIYYGNIKIANAKKLPFNEPLIIVCNHSNAFWDAVMLATTSKQKIWFLARGDVFKKPLVAKILTAIGIAPIFRMQEGYNTLTQNEAAFKKYYKMLAAKDTIAIYPEGNCFRESRLRPLKKGAARIALGAMESQDFKLPLKITAASLNYDEPDNLGSDVLINIGATIEVNSYKELFMLNPVKAVNTLTHDIAIILEDIHIDIKKEEDLFLYHFIKRNFSDLIGIRNDFSPEHEFNLLKRLSIIINQLSEHDHAKYMTIKQAVVEYSVLLQQSKLREKYVKAKVNRTENSFILPIQLIVGFPAFFIGFVFNSWPYYYAYYKARKKIKKAEFFTSVNIGSTSVLFIGWYVLLLLVFSWLFHSFLISVVVLLCVYFTGRFGLIYAKSYRKLRAMVCLNRIEKQNKILFMEIILIRDKVMELIKFIWKNGEGGN